MKKKNFQPVSLTGLALSVLVFTAGCSSNETAEPADTFTPTESSEVQASAEKIFYSIPAPLEMTGLMKRAGATYDKSLVNDPNSQGRYSTVNARALNLGVYGADLSYSTIFDNTQEALQYLKATQSLAEGLGITDAFDYETVTRVEANINNRDSLLSIISSSYMKTDNYLQNDGRGNVSALVIAGGWIESTYLATQTERKIKGNTEELKVQIAEQRYSLENLINYLNHYKSDATVDGILMDLNRLDDVYQKVSINSKAGSTVTDTVDRSTTIGGSSTVSISDDQLDEISSIVSTLRARIINLN